MRSRVFVNTKAEIVFDGGPKRDASWVRAESTKDGGIFIDKAYMDGELQLSKAHALLLAGWIIDNANRHEKKVRKA